ncbi:MAG: hypothetical protein GY722_08625 [bacterium]|nr:hypothetical protein [bacterium]
MKLIRYVVLLATILLFPSGPAAAQYKPEQVSTELALKKTRFRASEAIMMDVWVQNKTEADIKRTQFSPFSSAIGLPSFVIVRVPDGEEFSIPPGLFGDDWEEWYQLASGREAFSVDSISLPPKEPILLLRGDLRLTVSRAREYCQHALDRDSLLKLPGNANTMKRYREIVRSAEDFLKGGTFDIHVHAYSDSPTIRIHVEGLDSQP